MDDDNLILLHKHLTKVNKSLTTYESIREAEEGAMKKVLYLKKSLEESGGAKFKKAFPDLDEFCTLFEKLTHTSANIEYMKKIVFGRDNERTPENEDCLKRWQNEEKTLKHVTKGIGKRLITELKLFNAVSNYMDIA